MKHKMVRFEEIYPKHAYMWAFRDILFTYYLRYTDNITVSRMGKLDYRPSPFQVRPTGWNYIFGGLGWRRRYPAAEERQLYRILDSCHTTNQRRQTGSSRALGSVRLCGSSKDCNLSIYSSRPKCGVGSMRMILMQQRRCASLGVKCWTRAETATPFVELGRGTSEGASGQSVLLGSI